MTQQALKRSLLALVPPIRSLQQQRDAYAHLADDLGRKLTLAQGQAQKAEAAAAEKTAALAEALAALERLQERIAAPTFHFKGYDIPVDLMMMTGGGPETFELISRGHIHNLQTWIGLEPSHTVLEIGCGIGRDAIPLTEILRSGRYVGVDIIKRSIDWCTKYITARHPAFQFAHFDVEDQLHNGTGTTRTADIVLPLDDGSVDRIFLFSVFTHMLQPDIEHYLREFRRVLGPSGSVYATTFIYTDEILRKARETNLTPFDLRFEHELGPNCRINDPVHPLGAVGFTEAAWDEMLAASGMKQLRPWLPGAWSGFHAQPQDGQDVMILGAA